MGAKNVKNYPYINRSGAKFAKMPKRYIKKANFSCIIYPYECLWACETHPYGCNFFFQNIAFHRENTEARPVAEE